MIKFKRLFLLFPLLYFVSCKEPYKPQVTTVNANILVVEGFINTSADSTIISLSRTFLVSDRAAVKPELNANVSIENEANISYPLKDIGNGAYAANGLNLDKTKKHRIRIKTSNGTTYLSDFVEAKISPPIDDIGFEAKDDGIQLYVNTHDETNNSKYYKWEYYDTWAFYAKLSSVLKLSGTNVVSRIFPDDDIFSCYTSSKSTNIYLGSTIKLTKDVVSKAAINFIPKGSEKISVRYSTLVTQYVLTKEAYEFWEKLRKNTESLGSIFDAQPSQLTGNIHNVADLQEPVIGYISAGTMVKKRIFLEKSQLPKWTTIYPFDCSSIDTINNDVKRQAMLSGYLIPLEIITTPKGDFVTAASPSCADCTIRGSKKKPSFW